MSLHHDAAIGIAIFQMTALPIALLIPAWLIYPSRKERAAAAQATEEERKSLDHSRRAGRKLLIPPLAYFGSGALSYALPGFAMPLLGITTFLLMWFFIFFIAFNRKRSLSDGRGPSN